MDIHTNRQDDVFVSDDIKEPSLFNVVLLNDDFTPQDFVVAILVSIFNKAPPEAQKIMLTVHTQGRGFVGTYPYDIAATRCHQVVTLARGNGFPLECRLEKI